MLKFSGSSYLISGAREGNFHHIAHNECDCYIEHIFYKRSSLTFLSFFNLLCTLKQVYRFGPVLVAFKNLMIRGSAIHIAYRILAAFFIVMGA